MPFNPAGKNNEFYAAVHIGSDAKLAKHLAQFNQYLTRLCRIMQTGTTLSQLAVYLPNEDNWMAGEIPIEERTPGAVHRWQMRHVSVPEETEGYHPIWVSLNYLKDAEVKDQQLIINEASFQALYIDCAWLDHEALMHIYRLAQQGLAIIIKQPPEQAGHISDPNYLQVLEKLYLLPNVTSSIKNIPITAFISGKKLPFYWARETKQGIFVFLAHPATRDIHFPMKPQQSALATPRKLKLKFVWENSHSSISVKFEQYASVLLKLSFDGTINIIKNNNENKF